MTRYPVNDTNIITIGYDHAKQVLEIEFKLQAIHHYYGVSLDAFVALMKAPKIENHYLHFVYCHYPFEVS
jgi:KTSC domain